MRNACLVVLALCLALMTACTPNRTVQRLASDEQTDLSGRWNDTDSRLVADTMVRDVVSRPWLGRFMKDNDRTPVLIIGVMRNDSSEHIPMDIFVKDIARELLNSGTVRFVASRDERDAVRDERLEQQYNASEESAKRLAQETGADFMLQGSIHTIIDRVEGKQVKFYQVDMHLVEIETNETVWMGQKSIKKLVPQAKYKL